MCGGDQIEALSGRPYAWRLERQFRDRHWHLHVASRSQVSARHKVWRRTNMCNAVRRRRLFGMHWNQYSLPAATTGADNWNALS